MRRTLATLGSAIFFALAPGTLAGWLPWWISGWGAHPVSGGRPLAGLGILLMAAGGLVLLECFARFVWRGFGTPAPVFPTRHLVVSGLYRFVRNPMYVGVITVIVGQSLLWGSLSVLEYGAVVCLGFHLFVLGYEEPTLRSTFGSEYEEFCAHVPRWIPRLTPWDGLRKS